MAMRRANGTGSVTKIKGRNRRKPYRVRVTVGWEVDAENGKVKQITKDLGCFATQNEALTVLQDYLKDPYDLNASKMTVAELYDLWFDSLSESSVSDTYKRGVIANWRYCSCLYKLCIRDVRSYHLKDCIQNAEKVVTRGKNKGNTKKASPNIQSSIKSIFNLMFDYAYERDLVSKNYARSFNLDASIKEEFNKLKRENHEFNSGEIRLLWGSVGTVAFSDMVLIGIYSGWRPQELALLRLDGIDLVNNTMRGGLKTASGKNRVVPIHPDIRQLVVSRYEEAEKLGSSYLFNDPNGSGSLSMNYQKYLRRFNAVMYHFGMDHHPHETRHTFYTVADRCGMPELIRDKIVGHSSAGMSKVYDHQSIDDMKRELDKLRFLD